MERLTQLGIDKHFKIWQIFDKYTAWKVTLFGVFWSAFSCIRTKYGKIWSRKTPHMVTFHAVVFNPFQASVPFLFTLRHQKSSGLRLFSEMGRNIRSQMLYKLRVLKYSTQFTGKHMWLGLFLIRLQASSM